MSRTLAIAAALSLAIVPAAQAQQGPALLADAMTTAMTHEGAAATAADEVAEAGEPEPAAAMEAHVEALQDVEGELREGEEEYDAEYEEDYAEVEFCGGEESIVDLAYYDLERGDARTARDTLVRALRRGEVERWQRPAALVTLAEAQLELGDWSRAVVNYRAALSLDETSVGPSVRIGMAVALYRGGDRRAASQRATEVLEAGACAGRWTQAACYGAHQVLAQTARTSAERAEAAAALARVREAHGELADAFARVDERLDVQRPRASVAPPSDAQAPSAALASDAQERAAAVPSAALPSDGQEPSAALVSDGQEPSAALASDGHEPSAALASDALGPSGGLPIDVLPIDVLPIDVLPFHVQELADALGRS